MGKWLVSLAWPAISRILGALGYRNHYSFIGMEQMLRSAITQAQQSLGGLAPDI